MERLKPEGKNFILLSKDFVSASRSKKKVDLHFQPESYMWRLKLLIKWRLLNLKYSFIDSLLPNSCLNFFFVYDITYFRLKDEKK